MTLVLTIPPQAQGTTVGPHARAVPADPGLRGVPRSRASDLIAAPTLRVESLDDAVAWDRFVHTTPNATFFHRAGWKEVIECSFGHACHFLQAKCEDRITGVLPLVHLSSRLFGNALISTAYGVYGGPVASDEASAQALNQAAMQLAGQLDVDYLEYRLRAPSDLPWARNSGLYATFRKRLAPEPAMILREVPRKRGGSGCTARSTATLAASTASIPTACAISARPFTRVPTSARSWRCSGQIAKC